jgi:hypothetical protein
MSRHSRIAQVFCSVIATMTVGNAYSQYGYAPQVPAAGAGTGYGYPASNPYVSAPADPNMGMAYGAPAYQQQPMMGMAGAPAPSSMLTYGMLEASYASINFKNTGAPSFNGLGIALMAELFQPFYVTGGFNWASTSSLNGTRSKYTFNSVHVGVGGYIPLSQNFHLVGEVGGLYASLAASKASLAFSNGALYVNPKIRCAVSPDLEIDAGIFMTSADEYNSRSYDFAAFYRLFTAMDIGVGAGFGDITRVYHVGVRFRW